MKSELRIMNNRKKSEAFFPLVIKHLSLSIKHSRKGAYSIVEILMVMAIIFMFAGISLLNYNQFGREVELDNAVYELALTIRQAQFFGINRSDSFGSGFTDPRAYGVYFDITGGTTGLSDEEFMMFVDSYPALAEDRLFDRSETGGTECVESGAPECIDIFGFNRGNYIAEICVGDNEATCIPTTQPLHISFKRPDPDAEIYTGTPPAETGPYGFAKITVRAPAAGVASSSVSVGAAGQISIN